MAETAETIWTIKALDTGTSTVEGPILTYLLTAESRIRCRG